MYHELLRSVSFWRFLLSVDQDLAQTARQKCVEPWAYLQDVLSRLPTLPADRLAELLPDRWQAARIAASQAQVSPTAAAPESPR